MAHLFERSTWKAPRLSSILNGSIWWQFLSCWRFVQTTQTFKYTNCRLSAYDWGIVVCTCLNTPSVTLPLLLIHQSKYFRCLLIYRRIEITLSIAYTLAKVEQQSFAKLCQECLKLFPIDKRLPCSLNEWGFSACKPLDSFVVLSCAKSQRKTFHR